MVEPLNILVIEDCNADFLLVERHIRLNGLSARCCRVDTLIGLQGALARERWDLVLADYNVPQLDFQESLALLQAELPEMPVIMVTGTVGEERAVELLKLGVCDFVLKGHLSRLVPAIERSLREVGEHNARVVTEQALRNSEVHFRSIFNKSPVAIGIGEAASGLVVDVNQAWLSLFGYKRAEMVGRTTSELNLYVKPETRAEFVRMLSSCGQVVNSEVQVRRKTGEALTVLYSAELIELAGNTYLQVMLTDITDSKKLEEQIRQSQKMHAVGQLAGGVAHDFNNILSAIYGYSYLIQDLAKDPNPIAKYIQEIINASERAAVLTGTLLTFIRKQAVTLAEIDLKQVLMENEAFLRRLIREDIELKIVSTAEPLFVLVDRGQVEQVVMNLVANARDAMPNGGKVTIGLTSAILDQEFIDSHGYGTCGSYVVLSVADNGVGMDKSTQARVFEPFFTTKAHGAGTGLGLSLAYGIINRHDGFIGIESALNTGTIFRIYLPIVISPMKIGITKAKSVGQLRGGEETILIGEDDPVVLKLIAEILSPYGYRVIETADGQDAIDSFVENVDGVRLVILDEIMPKKNGRAVFQEMTKIRPDLKVIFVSGYGENIFAEESTLGGNSFFIPKPFSPVELVDKVRAMLDQQ